jgi:hypothetical protein
MSGPGAMINAHETPMNKANLAGSIIFFSVKRFVPRMNLAASSVFIQSVSSLLDGEKINQLSKASLLS